MRAWIRGALAGLAVATAACQPAVDLQEGLQIVGVSTGWFDDGFVNGQNRLVPAISFQLKNVSDQNLTVLQVNSVFRRVTEEIEWGAAFMTVAGSEGLPPGETSSPITARSNRGYTGSNQSRQEMLENSQFVDAKVEVFAKYGSNQWTRIGEFPVTRQLIVR
jgi:hypothetical protein